MTSLTIQLPESKAKFLRKRAKQTGTTLDSYVASLIIDEPGNEAQPEDAGWWKPMFECNFTDDFFEVMDTYLEERKHQKFEERQLFS